MNPLIAKFEKMVAVLSADDRQTLNMFCAVTQIVEKGRDIVREGEQSEHIYIVLDGWAARYKVRQDGSRQITAFLLPGDTCNYEATVLSRVAHSVVALTPVTVAVVARDILIAAARDRPDLAQAFWRAAMLEQAMLRAWVVNIGRHSAYKRVAHQACELHARLSYFQISRQDHFDLPLTQEHLGDALGLTAVHVNRVLRQLRDEGLMQLQDRKLTLLDAKRLAALSGFNPDYLHTGSA